MISKTLDSSYCKTVSVVSVAETCGCHRKLPQCLLSADYKVLERQTSIMLGQEGKNVVRHNGIPRKYKHLFRTTQQLIEVITRDVSYE